MIEPICINIYSIIGSAICVSPDDGLKVYEIIKKSLDKNKHITVSFQNVDIVIAAFFNTAFGQLYSDFNETTIRKYCSVKDIKNEDLYLLKRVVDNAKLFYKDPERMEQQLMRYQTYD